MSDSVKNTGGRPRLYEDADVFAERVDAYFADCKTEDTKPTLAGLALFLGFDDRESVTHYATYGEAFSRTVKRAKLKMEDNRQQLLLSKDKFTPGVALDLQNNHGWKNKSETELSGPDGGPIRTAGTLDVSGLSNGALEEIAGLKAE